MLNEIRSLYPFGGTFPWPTDGASSMPAQNPPGWSEEWEKRKQAQKAAKEEQSPTPKSK